MPNSVREKIESILSKSRIIKNGFFGYEINLLSKEILTVLSDEVGKMKDVVPAYPKGSDGEVLKHLQIGYNQAISDIQEKINISCLKKLATR